MFKKFLGKIEQTSTNSFLSLYIRCTVSILEGIRRYQIFVTSYKYHSFWRKVTSYRYIYLLENVTSSRYFVTVFLAQKGEVGMK